MKTGLIVLLLSSLIFFYNIDRFPLKNWDEAWYAEITKNMASDNYSFLVPYWNGQYYFDKPPLYFWLSYPFFKFFGPGEWQARVVSATAATLCTLLVFLIARKLFDTKAATLSVLVFLTTGHVVGRFREGDLDALMVFLFVLSFWLYLLAKEKKIFYVLVGVSIGLGMLVKGWLLGLFPLATILSYSIFVEKKFAPKFLALTILFALVTSLWWFAAGIQKFGKPFLDWYVFSPAGGNLSAPLVNFSTDYLRFFSNDFGYWLLAGVVSFVLLRKQKPLNNKLLALTLPTFSFIFLLNFLNEKMDWYLLPAYPFLAIVAGYMLGKMWNIKRGMAIFVLAIALVGQLPIVYWLETRYPDRSHIGATLGKQAKEIVQSNEVVILDDHDFTAFLFYSDLGRVYEVSEKGGKDWEWWILRYKDIPEFMQKRSGAWVISKNLPGTVGYTRIVNSQFGYKFGKVN